MADGSIGHAQVRTGDSVVLMFEGWPVWHDIPPCLRLYVPDANAVFRRALAAGATAVTEMTELF